MARRREDGHLPPLAPVHPVRLAMARHREDGLMDKRAVKLAPIRKRLP